MTKRVLSFAGVGGLGVVMLVLGAVHAGHAQVSAFPTSDRPAGYIVFPKIAVDLDDHFCNPLVAACPRRHRDTLVQLTLVGNPTKIVAGIPQKLNRVIECFYVDATSQCNNTNPARPCEVSADCPPGGQCLPRWSQTNFTLVVTPEQPVGWTASAGIDLSTIHGDGKVPPLAVPGQFPYFVGELKCVQVDGETIVGTTTRPILANELKGEASVYDVSAGVPGSVDVRSYSAVGFQAQDTHKGQLPPPIVPATAQVLCLGSTPGHADCATADYAACPSILVVDHFFDGAIDPVSGASITSDLTLVPCTEDLRQGGNGANNQTPTTAQILVFNEFEQRLSTQVRLSCFKETPLSLIDQTRGNEKSSVFNFAVQSTLTGQTRIRPVLSSDMENGNGLLALVEEFHGSSSAAYNVNYVGTNSVKGDFVRFDVGP